jgi:hypothetical protein
MRRGIANLRGLDLKELQNSLYEKLCYGLMAMSALVIVVKNMILWCSLPGFYMSWALGSQMHLYLFMQCRFKLASLNVSWWSLFLLNVV